MFLLILSMACGRGSSDTTPAWAMNEASVVPSASGVEGVQVWTLYSQRWERKLDDRYRICTVLQDLRGTVVASYEGCEHCTAMYELTLDELENDCPEGTLDDLVLDGMVAIGIGDVPADIAEDDPYPGSSLGWFISFNHESAEGHGFAYDEVLETGGAADGARWRSGQTYALSPAYAWEL